VFLVALADIDSSINRHSQHDRLSACHAVDETDIIDFLNR
jgi:hypothetical protein